MTEDIIGRPQVPQRDIDWSTKRGTQLTALEATSGTTHADSGACKEDDTMQDRDSQTERQTNGHPEKRQRTTAKASLCVASRSKNDLKLH